MNGGLVHHPMSLRFHLLLLCSAAVTVFGAAPKYLPPIQIGGFGQSIVTILANQDFDGDGHKDLVVADHAAGTVTVLRNVDGTGKNLGAASTLNLFA